MQIIKNTFSQLLTKTNMSLILYLEEKDHRKLPLLHCRYDL